MNLRKLKHFYFESFLIFILFYSFYKGLEKFFSPKISQIMSYLSQNEIETKIVDKLSKVVRLRKVLTHYLF
jgi:hypothetical protein